MRLQSGDYRKEIKAGVAYLAFVLTAVNRGGTILGPLLEFAHTNLFSPRVYSSFLDFSKAILSELEQVFSRLSVEKNHL